MKNLWIGLYHHRYGVDAFVRFQDNEPTEQQFIDDIRKETDWEDDERVEVRGPWTPTQQAALTCLESS